MNYVVMQESLDIPDTEKLKRAFRAVGHLVAADAAILANDAYGILVPHQSYEEALAVQAALFREGINTEVVASSELVPLPPTKLLHQLDCQPETLQVYDALGRGFPVEWRHLTVISAGLVKSVRMTTVKEEYFPNTFTRNQEVPMTLDRRTSYRTKETREPRWMMELILGPGAARFTLEPERANDILFLGLGDRRTTVLEDNVRLLLGDLVAHAPQARLNPGAEQLLSGTGKPAIYPSRSAFHEELTWMLWRMIKKGA